MQGVAPGHAVEATAWAVRSGRDIRFGPDWPESGDRLAFDACSGDYWVLDELGHRVLRQLLDRAPLSAGQLRADLGLDTGETLADDGLAPVLARLQEAGLIQSAPAGAD